MNPIKTLVTQTQLEDLASRSNFRYGKAIAEDGDVTFLQKDTFNLVARVKHKNGEARTTELMSTPKGFRYRCTCTSRKDLFCKHCVAVGLSFINNI